jgi:hypothetical protein
VVVGSGVQGFAGDGGLATAAELDSPMGLAVDATGDLFVADSHNQRVREVAAGSGVITTVAGTGSAGFAGDGGPAKAAVLDLPTALACDAAGNLFVADTGNHRVRKIAAGSGVITTVVGNGVEGFGGDGGVATAAVIDSPGGLAVDAAGNLYLADTHNGRVRVVSAATGAITTVASAGLALPRGLTVDAAGNVVVADSANHRVRTISPAGVITTVAGEGTQTFAGDGGPAVAASLDSPGAVALSPAGLVTLADSGNQRVRQVDGLTPPEIHTVPWTAGAGLVSVTAVPNPVAILYGQAVPALTGTLTGVLPADAGKVTAVFTSSAGGLSPVGSYPISATLTGSAAGNYVLTVAPASVTIAKAPVVVTAISSSGNVSVGTPVTVNVTVASTTSGAPTGSVTLLDGTAVLGMVPLPAGVAAWTTSALAQGTHALSAAYAGDGNFLPGASAVVTVVVGTAQDFTLATTGVASQSVPAGSAATFNFSVAMQGAAISSPILLAVQGVPTGATASLNPASIVPGGPGTFTLTIQTPYAGLDQRWGPQVWWAGLLIPLVAWRRRRALRGGLLLGVVLVLGGCGNRVNTAPELSHAATYTITVTATATGATGNAIQHSANVTLQVL